MNSHTLIWVVDDDEDIRNTLKLYLQEAGYQNIKMIESGTQACTLMLSDCEAMPMLIITDYQMPGLKGNELIATIRRNSKCPKVPIILMSGDELTSIPPAGWNHALPKPFDLKFLLQVVGYYLPLRTPAGVA